MHSDDFQHAWKNLVDSITQHPSTKPFRPLTVREEQLTAEVEHLRHELRRIYQALVVMAIGLRPIVGDDGDEELF